MALITAAASPSLMIVDDHTLSRRGLAKLLESDPRVRVVGAAANAAEAMEKIATQPPDVVLVDIKVPTMDGIDTTRRIVGQYPNIKVLVLTTSDNDGQLVQALKAGASGYLLKESEPEAIVSAVLAVLLGELVVTQSVASELLSLIDGSRRERLDGMTHRQIEILRLLGRGLTNKQIASRLTIRDKTVRNHITSIYSKLGVDSRSQAILYALRRGLVEA